MKKLKQIIKSIINNEEYEIIKEKAHTTTNESYMIKDLSFEHKDAYYREISITEDTLKEQALTDEEILITKKITFVTVNDVDYEINYITKKEKEVA